MSLNYWGFTRTPFTKELPIEDLYPSTQFRELAARLHLMVEGRLFGVVTGEVGSGKSSAVRSLASQLDPTSHPVFYVAESQLTPFDFYSQILEAAGVTTPFQRSQTRRQFVLLMTDLWQHQHKAPVIVIDEGQGLPARMLDELRFVLLCRIHSYAERSEGGLYRKHLRRQVLGITTTIPGRPRACQAGDSVLASRPLALCGRWLAL